MKNREKELVDKKLEELSLKIQKTLEKAKEHLRKYCQIDGSKTCKCEFRCILNDEQFDSLGA